MSVRAIRLQNFMAFKDTGWIELRPITLLFGRNSSGKSALIRALRLLKQSLEVSTLTEPLVFLTEDGLDQGGFLTTVNHRELEEGELDEKEADKRSITFHFRCDLSATIDALREAINRHRVGDGLKPIGVEEAPTWADLSVSFAWNPRPADSERLPPRVELVGVHVECPWDVLHEQRGHTIIETAREIVNETQPATETNAASWSWSLEWWPRSDILYGHEIDGKESVWLTADVEPTSGWLPLLSNSINLTSIAERPSTLDFNLVAQMLSEFGSILTSFFRSIDYLGPMRPQPERLYAMDRLTIEHLKRRGLHAWTRFLLGDVDEARMKELGKWMKCLKLGKEVRVQASHVGNVGSMSTVSICLPDKQWVDLKDVGYGASQVLPIIVESVLVAQNEPLGTQSTQSTPLVVIEQPELHLHPRAQANLTNIFIDTIYRTSGKKEEDRWTQIKREPSRVRFLLETHSEHLLLRLRRRISETSANMTQASINPSKYLCQDDLAMYFVNEHEQRWFSEITEIEIGEYGDFLNIPEGFGDFFSDDLIEASELARARLSAGLTWRRQVDDSRH